MIKKDDASKLICPKSFSSVSHGEEFYADLSIQYVYCKTDRCMGWKWIDKENEIGYCKLIDSYQFEQSE